MNLSFAIPNVTVPNAAALTAQTGLAGLADGARAHVATYGDDFRLITQAGGLPALDANVVVASSAAGRVWARITNVVNQRWAQQTAWFIDTVAGNDQNDGNTNVTQLATWAEYRRRVPVPRVDHTITVSAASAFAATDPMAYMPIEGQAQAAGVVVTVMGTRTRTALPNIVTSTNVVPATGTPPTLDLGVALTPGSILEATATGNTTVVQFLIAGTNYAVTEWCTNAGANVIPPVAGSAMALLSFPTAPRLAISSTHTMFLVQNFNFAAIDTTVNRTVCLRQCTFPAFVIGGSSGSGTTNNQSPMLETFAMEGCSVTGATMAWIGPYHAKSYLTGYLCRVVLQNNAFLDIRRSVVSPNPAQAIALEMSGGSFVFSFNLCISGSTTTGIDLHSGSIFKQVAGGAGPYGLAAFNAGKGTRVREGSRFMNAINNTPTLFSTGQELELDNAATANGPPPLATGVIPAAVALVTWVQLQAAPFNGSVISYSTGAAILLNNP